MEKVVTITNNKIQFWEDRNIAIGRFQDCLFSTNFCWTGDTSGIKRVLNELSEGKDICCDSNYDAGTMLKASIAYKTGNFLNKYIL